MKPIAIDVAKYHNAKKEIAKTEALINKVIDKYKVQVEIKNLNGVSLYSAPLSQNVTGLNGLGDVERGSGEKLKNLENLIEKQNVLAQELIQMHNAQYAEDYYTKLQKLNTARNNIFCGVVVRWLGMKDKDIIQIQNNIVYPNGNVLVS